MSSSYYSALLWACTVALAVMGGSWWLRTLPHAIYDLSPSSAVDLISRYEQVHNLFAGVPIYSASNAVYPPAAYVTLWPLMGWTSVEMARILWLGLSIVSVVGLGLLTAHLGRPTVVAERWFLLLIPFSMHATGGVLRFGQVTLVVVLALMLALTLLQRPSTWLRDIGVAMLMVVALIKPTVSAPFFWIILFWPKSWRPAALVVALYGVLTLSAAAWQDANPILLFQAWSSNALAGADYAATGVNSVSQQGALAKLNLPNLDLPVALAMLVCAGGWVAWRRNANVWLLIGIVAITARLWTYHAGYDNLLLLPMLIALYRLQDQSRDSWIGSAARLLFAANLLFLVALGPVGLPRALRPTYDLLQLVTWLITAVCLLALSSPFGTRLMTDSKKLFAN